MLPHAKLLEIASYFTIGGPAHPAFDDDDDCGARPARIFARTLRGSGRVIGHASRRVQIAGHVVLKLQDARLGGTARSARNRKSEIGPAAPHAGAASCTAPAETPGASHDARGVRHFSCF